MTSHSLHPTIAELREAERRRAAAATRPVAPPRPPGRLAQELAPVVSIVAGVAALLAIAAPSL
jgi:hypothetical protein